MPVQINEVVVRTTVEPEPQDQRHTTGASPSIPSRESIEMEIAEIVSEILKDKKER